MPRVLSEAAVAQYRSAGYYFPLRILSEPEAGAYRRRLEQYETSSGAPIGGPYRHKSHLLFTWLAELVRLPRILDIVEDVLGPDLLVWNTSFFIKEPQTRAYVSWHQDATYWGLSSPDVMTVWVGFTASNLESGCMKVIPGTHTTDVVPHRDTFAKDNLLTRGQEVAVEVDGTKAVDLIMAPGEASLHHVRLVHGSEPNTSQDRRIGFAIRYIPTCVRQIAGAADSASLVRGKDQHGNFELEPCPKKDLDPEMLALHKATTEKHAKILYRGTGVDSFQRSAN